MALRKDRFLLTVHFLGGGFADMICTERGQYRWRGALMHRGELGSSRWLTGPFSLEDADRVGRALWGDRILFASYWKDPLEELSNE